MLDNLFNLTLRTRVGGGFKPPPTAIGLIGSRASRPRRGQDARTPSGNRAENQPPATYCVTSVNHRIEQVYAQAQTPHRQSVVITP